jgi:hypothetical protein
MTSVPPTKLHRAEKYSFFYLNMFLVEVLSNFNCSVEVQILHFKLSTSISSLPYLTLHNVIYYIAITKHLQWAGAHS